MYKPIYNYHTKVIIFDLRKPIFGSAYSLYEGHIKGKEKWRIILNAPEGTATYKNFADYKKQAKKIEMIYNFQDRPMVMWQRSIYNDIQERTERKEKEAKKIQDFSMPLSIFEELKLRNPDLVKKIRSI